MRGFLMDLRFALRSLRRDAGPTLLALLALVLGLGVNVAVLSLLNAILLRPLPFAEPERLVWIRMTSAQGGGGSTGVSARHLEEWRQAASLTGLAGYHDRLFRLTAGERPERVSGAVVGPSLFSVLGVEAQLGRTFTLDEGDDDAVLLGHDLWQRRFGGDTGVIGRPLEVDGQARTIVGVMPPRFRFPEFAELWTPLAAASGAPGEIVPVNLTVVARLRLGLEPAVARQELMALDRSVASQLTTGSPRLEVLLRPLREYYVGDTATVVLLFLMVSGGLLLVASANLANFLLARALARQREIAVRSSLGARRRRVARQLLTESLLLAFVGCGLGLAVGALGLRLLVASIPVELPFWADFRIDWRVSLLTVGFAAVAGVLFGLAPTVHALRLDIASVLQVARQQGGLGRRRLMGLLVASEVALACAIFLAAGSMGRGFLEAQRADPGFTLRRALTVVVDFGGDAYHDESQRRQIHRRLVAALGSLPGAHGAGATSALPLREGQVRRVVAVGADERDEKATTLAAVRFVTPGYTDLLEIPLLAGRRLREGDAEAAALVDRTFASRVLGTSPAAAIGGRFSFASAGEEEAAVPIEVVGVLQDHRQSLPGQTARPAAYLTYDAQPFSLLAIVVPTAGDPETLSAAARGAVTAVDRTIPVIAVRPLEQILAEAMWQPRVYTWLLGVFAAVGLALAALGVQSLVSYSVNRRFHEIGIRVALGARRARLLVQVLRQAIAVVAVGLVVGLGAGTVLSRALGGFLVWQGSPSPALLVGLGLFFAVLALIAAWLPARRALTVDPAVALRDL